MRHRFDRSLLAPALVLVLIGAIGLSAATAATTEYTIAPGGPPLTVAISVAGDDAAAVFDGVAGQRVSLRLSGVTIGPSGCCSTKVSILKPDGTTLVAPTNVGTLGGFLDATTLPVSGAYRIFVDPQGTSTGSITLTLYDVPADLNGTIVPGGAAVTVTTTTPGQNARLTFAGTAAQRVSLKVGPVCCSTKISILKPDGTTVVAPVTVGTSGGFVDPATLPVNGTYTIVADPQSSAAGSITLTLYDVPADLSGTIVPGGAAVTVTTTTPGQNARLTFAGTAAQRVSLNVAPVCCSTKVSILKPDGTTFVAPVTFGTAGGFVDVKSLTVTGVYTIVADPQSSAVGSMTLRLYNVPADVTGTIVPGSPLTVTTTVPGQNGRLTFGGTASGRISLTMSGVTMSNSKVSILKPDGTTLVAATTIPTAGAFIDAKTLPTSGTYTIVVDPQTTATGSMTLRLYDLPPDASAAAVPGGGAVTVTTTTPGQNARVTFDGAVDQRVSVQFSGVTIGTSTCCSTKASILKPDGTTLVAAMNVGTSGGFIDAKTLPVAGTYTIVLDPQSSATGSATIAVNNVTDAPAAIVPGGPAVTLTTTTAGENARAAFDGVAGRRVSLAMTGVTITNSTVSILKPDGTALVAMANIGTSGGFIDAATLPVDGSYSILVDPQGTATGRMTLTLYDVPADASASSVPGGAAVTVATTTPGQNAKVTFPGAANQRVFLKLSSVTIGPSTNTKVSMLKPDGTTLVAPTTVGTGGGFLDTTTLPVAGTYTILVDPQSTATGGMTLRLFDVPPDVTATTSPGGPPVAVTTTTSGQNAKVTFEGVAGRQASLRVAWSPTVCCLIKVSITRPDGGTVLAPFSVGATGAFIDAKMLPVSGTYTILVDPQSSAAGTTTLTLYDVPPDVTAPITPGGPAVTLTTTADGQNARFTFAAAAGDGALVTIGPNCCATNVSVLKPDGVAVAPAVVFQAAGGTLTARLPVAGTYTILVDLQGQVMGSVTARLVLDSGAPDPPVLTITESSPDGHGNGATFYYRPGSSGTFTVNAATSDSGSGVQRVTFPALSGGFTPTILISDSTSPYSQLYTWATTATFSSTLNTVTVYDNVGNTSSAKFTVVQDSTPPATTDDTGSIGFGWKNTTQTVTLAPSDGGSGVAATHYTSNGSTPTTASAQGTLVTLSADGVYTIKYFSVDNVANSEAVKTAGTQIRVDKTNPTSTTTFPASGGRYNAAGWNAGCAAAGFCGTASDALSGVQKVELSIRQGSGNYWDGTAFASASEVFLAASGTTAWSSAFTAANFPADGSYTIGVRATDNATNVQTPASRTFTYDTAPPDTTITAAPANPFNSASASFSFTATEAGTFQCSLDGGAFAACTSPKSYTGLAAGAHTFQVRATDSAGNTDASPAIHSWTIDLTAPDTTIDSGPPTPTIQTSASFSFSSNEAGSTFQCSLDAGAFTACTSPKSYSGLSGANHTFRVRATDPAGNTDATPASYTWTVDLTAPQTTILAGPASSTNSTSANFIFSSSEPGGTFECSLDGEAFTACTSPKPFSGLAEGSHTFQVRATDSVGNTDATPATHNWTIDLVAPDTTITAGPPSLSNSASASFSFSSNEAGSTFQCSLDAGAFTACTSPKSYTGLSGGAHTFRVRAIDPAGNTDATAASYGWTVDLTVPETTIDSGPPTPTNQTGASFSFSSSEAGSSFECSLDGGSFAPCTSAQAYGGLAEGAHSFRVRATDAAGNTDATPASYSWTVDLSAPETTIASGPADPTNVASASFSFSASEAGSSFECSLDGAAFSACASPEAYAGLTEDVHSFQVRATDPAGNTDASPASFGWRVDLSAPAAPVITDPADNSTTTSATVTLAGTAEPGTSVELFDGASSAGAVAADGAGAWTITLTGVADGLHTYTAKASDAAGNTSTVSNSRAVTVDTSAPETTIDSGPADPTNQTSASFSFSSSETGSSFECSLDGAPFAACASPDSHSGLTEGAHSFRVRATDAAGNTDGSPASYGWTVDLSAPQTTVDSGPADPTNQTGASFSFSSSEAGGSFACSLDGGAFAACSSPQSYSGLAAGNHGFEVRATDPAGNTDASPASYGWTVDLSAPQTTIDSGPADPTNQTGPSFSFSSSETGSSFECSLDGAPFAACASPEAYAGLAEGAHSFEVRATDAAGNTDASPASYAWTVDLSAPQTTVDSGPADPTADTFASFVFSASESGASFECSLDGAAFAACANPQDYTGLAPGSHLFEVRATDPAGNADASPASYGWTVL